MGNRRPLLLLAAVGTAILLTGCSQTPDAKHAETGAKSGDMALVDMTDAEISVDALAAHLLEKVAFADTLVPMEAEIAGKPGAVRERPIPDEKGTDKNDCGILWVSP